MIRKCGATDSRREADSRLAVVNLKGGTAKTTTAVHLASGLGTRGRTLLIDADPQGSALAWSESAGEMTVAVVALPVRDLHRRVGPLAEDYAHLVIDTPPGDLGIVRSALLAVDLAILPVGPTPMDLDRLMATVDLLAEIEDSRPVRLMVLLTRVRQRTRSAREVRAALEDLGVPVMTAEVPLRETIGLSFGMPVTAGPYAAIVDEIMTSEVNS